MLDQDGGVREGLGAGVGPYVLEGVVEPGDLGGRQLAQQVEQGDRHRISEILFDVVVLVVVFLIILVVVFLVFVLVAFVQVVEFLEVVVLIIVVVERGVLGPV